MTKFAAFIDCHSYSDRVTEWFDSSETCYSFCRENGVKFSYIDGVINWFEMKPINFFKNNQK